MPSTTVTPSHVNQGKVEYESTVPWDADKGLDLWEALWKEVNDEFQLYSWPKTHLTFVRHDKWRRELALYK
jgi:hypothetical protein